MESMESIPPKIISWDTDTQNNTDRFQVIGVGGGILMLAITVLDALTGEEYRFLFMDKEILFDKIGNFEYYNVKLLKNGEINDISNYSNDASTKEYASLDEIRDGVIVVLSLSFYGSFSEDGELIINIYRRA